MDNMRIWDKVKQPPKSALKTINGGRMSGKTDISPQWRYEALTAIHGPCGIGWRYTIDRLWTESGSGDEVAAFALVTLYICEDGVWSEGIPGIGGSAFVTKESKGVHTSDECYKMAVTDAISVACKALGLAADIYAGRFDGSKYAQGEPPLAQVVDPVTLAAANAAENEIRELMRQAEALGEIAALVRDSAEFAGKMTALKGLSVEHYERCRGEIRRRLK